MGKRVLVVEDELHVRELLRIYLEREGCAVTGTGDGESALAALRDEAFDLLILDIMLPRLDGWEVCRRAREMSDVPIIMLTAKETDLDKITGLELGADEYVTKPFSPSVLMARVRALFRRVAQLRGHAPAGGELRFRALTVNETLRRVTLNGALLQLTPREFDLLWFLASHPGQVFTRERLLERVWGFDFAVDTRTVDACIKRLRQKLSPSEDSPVYIHTVWGVGYKFEEAAA